MAAATATATAIQTESLTNNASGDINAKKAIKENPNKKPVFLGKNVEPYQLKRMPIILRSKFSFYIEPSATVSEAQISSQKRLREQHKHILIEREKTLKEFMDANSIYSSSVVSGNITAKQKKINLEETEKMIKLEKEKHERLIGQLKAAEARNRNRILKMKYLNSKQDEIDHIIDSQSTALKAVRLEAFLPPVRQEKLRVPDNLNPIQKRRLEAIIDDATNSLVERRLY